MLQPEFDVIGVVSDGRMLLQVASKDRPDVVLLDISMPELNGLDAMTQLKQRHRSIKVIFLTVTARPDVAAEAFRRGASGYMAKHCSVDELIVAVRSVLRGESFLSPRISKDEVEFLLRSNRVVPPRKHITAREREVLRLLVEGKATSEIGQVLQIKPGTVAYHKYRMIEALGLKTTAELIRYAICTRCCEQSITTWQTSGPDIWPNPPYISSLSQQTGHG